MPLVAFPDRTLEIGLRQAQMLVAKGLIKPGKNTFVGRDSEAALRAMIEDPSTMVCDFCHGTPVLYEYPCRDFISPLTDSHSIGAWLACATCANYIKRGDHEGLAERAVNCYFEQHADQAEKIEVQVAVELGLRALHHEFFRHVTGPGKRV